MTLLFPGAAWVPIPGQQNRARRRKGRGVGYHVAVFVGPSIEKIDEGTGNDSHLYVRFDGSVEQNVDLDLISYAMVDGNATLITVETEGGANPATVETEPWTPAQVATLARIARWAHDTEGVPLQVMPDSLPASRGLAPHRWGIDPWRVPGGEVWSSSYGKACPGDAKVAQLPSIAALAAQNPEEDIMNPAQQALLEHVSNQCTVLQRSLSGTAQTIGSLSGQVAALTTVIGHLPGGTSVDMAAVKAAADEAATAAIAKLGAALTAADAPPA